MTTKHLDIGGMHCGACAMGIQMMLSTTDGVTNATVDYNTKKGEVEFDEKKVTLDQLIKVIEELTYTAKAID
jgi:Cu+-exporting ATPase